MESTAAEEGHVFQLELFMFQILVIGYEGSLPKIIDSGR